MFSVLSALSLDKVDKSSAMLAPAFASVAHRIVTNKLGYNVHH